MSTMKSAQTVYYGPGTVLYQPVGSVSSGEYVIACWKEGSWVHIEYNVTGTTNKKRGYVLYSSINLGESIDTIIAGDLVRYVHDSADTYTGPAGTGYVKAGSVSRGEQVRYLNIKINNYAYIQYDVDGTNYKKRAYFYSNNLGFSPPSQETLVIGQRPSDMNISGPSYMSNTNIYYAQGYVNECTWFCWGRAHEKKGKYLTFNGSNNGGEWYDNINAAASGVTKRPASQGPVSNSICSCSGQTSDGHVIFVESVVGNNVYYTEAHVGGTDGVVKMQPKSNFPPNRTAYGYIVL